ncbi:hypothetical protein Cgig2_028719 [Carnegiea gigantea]|uniref:Uncharacterized protein n=1 Tax=Carnegiea gigantea TaxID=171969 RepID=A0A9Q1KCU5_9CARY|nr:hypothetical protein Cgig2_028719 [Carnegiea gigantea]
MIHPSDKVRGTPLTVQKTQRFNDFFTTTGSIDANVQGRIFTWKKFLRGQLIYEKLDKVIFREDCAQLFPTYLVTNGPFTCSDHAFILLNNEPAHQPRRVSGITSLQCTLYFESQLTPSSYTKSTKPLFSIITANMKVVATIIPKPISIPTIHSTYNGPKEPQSALDSKRVPIKEVAQGRGGKLKASNHRGQGG